MIHRAFAPMPLASCAWIFYSIRIQKGWVVEDRRGNHFYPIDHLGAPTGSRNSLNGLGRGPKGNCTRGAASLEMEKREGSLF